MKAGTDHKSTFFRLLRNRATFRLFLLKKLPAAYAAGLKIEDIDGEGCTVSVPYGWFTQNPFRSTYFACLGMAAEMSTGALAMAAVYKRKPSLSMLIIRMESTFHKKAVAKTSFTCTDAKRIEESVRTAIETGEAQSLIAYAKGVNEKGELVAEFWFTWSFKAKRSER